MEGAKSNLHSQQFQGEHSSATTTGQSAPPGPLDTEYTAWAQFAEADNVDGFCRSWLAIQCRVIDGVLGALVLLGPPNMGPFTPAAVWPDIRRDMSYLTGAAKRALTERRGLLLRNQNQSGSVEGFHVAYPIEVDSELHGVIVLDVALRPEAELQAVLRQLHWGAAWLEVLFHRQESQRQRETGDKLISVLDLTTSSIEQDRFYTSAMAFVNDIATRFSCHRVSIGFLRGNHITIEAISHSAQFDKKSDLVTALGAAMEEALDQEAVVVYPSSDKEGAAVVCRAHEHLARRDDTQVICTIPLYDSKQLIGALTLERLSEQAFDSEAIEILEAAAAMAGPVFEAKRKNDRFIIFKIGESLHKQLAKITGPRHVGYKLAAGLLTLLLAFLVFADGDYRVTAKTVIEGRIQRALVAPVQSYIAEANARAGDIVKAGQSLALLDDKDLKLERLRSYGKKEQLLRENREAMAEHDRPKIRITLAQLSQANAQLELLDYQLLRTDVTAPFDGIIVSGDLSQSLGAPVDKGQVLFEIAPLDAYRVILQVDERDVTDVAVGQKGRLALSSVPGKELSFSIEKITPVSTSEEGRTYFRVEAELDEESERLRPGMEGVGKIYVDRRKQIWIWTHEMVYWFRLWKWSWWP